MKKNKISFLLIFIFGTVLSWENQLEEIKKSNEFATSTYSRALKSSNEILSPFSAETILSLLYFGTRSYAALQLQQGLKLPKNKKSLIKTENYTLHVANKLFVQATIKDSFFELARNYFGADFQKIDFDNFRTLEIVNRWIRNHTKTIGNLFSLDPDFRVVFVNALQFEEKWEIPFPVKDTLKKNFSTFSKIVQVETLHLTRAPFKYYKCEFLKTQLLELLLKANSSYLYLALPEENSEEALNNLENHLDRLQSIDLWRVSKVNVTLPKFRIFSQTNFTPILKRLGVLKIFTEDDFSGVAKGVSWRVDPLEQQAFIEVGEKGVEVGVATLAGLKSVRSLLDVDLRSTVAPFVLVPKSGSIYLPEENFVADHGFIFWVKIKGVVVFAGRVTNP